MTHKLLLIDDDPSIHALVKAQFNPRRYKVISAYDGKSGLEAAASILQSLDCKVNYPIVGSVLPYLGPQEGA